MNSTIRFFLSTYTPDGWNSLGPCLRREQAKSEACLLLSGPGCGGGELLRQAGEAAGAQGLAAETLYSPIAPFLPEAMILPERHTLAAIAAPFGGSVPPLPGPSEAYVNLTDCYDRVGLREIQPQAELCMEEEAQYTQRAARCLRAVQQLSLDVRSTLLTPLSLVRIQKRAAGILARELRPLRQPTAPVCRYLSAYTTQGHVAFFDTVASLCGRIYEVVDNHGLSHALLSEIAAGAAAAGYETIACLSPLEPERLEHLLIPERSLAFVTSTPGLPWPGAVSRRIHMDTLLSSDVLRRSRGRLRFIRKMISALQEECNAALAQAGQLHQITEELYASHVDQDVLRQLREAAIAAMLSVSE